MNSVTAGLGLRAAAVDHCCSRLVATLPARVSFPGSPSYAGTQNDFFSLQESQLSPACIVAPASSEEVSITVSILSQNDDCLFAVKGGGHAPAAGFASINNGITVDMTHLDSVSVNADGTVASVGAGATWLQAYEFLDPLHLTVAGGRNAAVGVGGLTIGGGISYFGPRVGWTCDTVTNFEVVLSSGDIVNANRTSQPDLWRALKGGSSNFGIVTRYDLATIPQSQVWGGKLVNAISSRREVLDAFAGIAGASDYDEYTSLVSSFIFSSPSKSWVISNLATYTKPIENPAVYEPLLAVQPQLQNTLGITNVSTLTNEGSPPPTFNIEFATGTYGVSVELLNTIFDVNNATVYELLPKVNGTLIWVLAYEPLPTKMNQYGQIKGGNSLGTSPKDGNAFIVLVTALWSDANAGDSVKDALRAITEQVDATARSMSLKHEFEYLNYANENQHPLRSYGEENFEHLRKASRKYDARGMFQNQVPGGFKLWRDDEHEV